MNNIAHSNVGACPKALESPALKSRHKDYPARYMGLVPWKIRMLQDVCSDIPQQWSLEDESKAFIHAGDIVECWVNSLGAMAAICRNGEALGVKPDEFEVIQFHGEPPLMPAHIKNCARCGHDHPGLLFRQLKRVGQAPGSEWSHWASCPETGEPIMLAVVDDEKRKPGEPPLF